MFVSRLTLLGCLFLFGPAAASLTLISSESHFGEALDTLVDSSDMVGLAVAIVRDGKLSFVKTYGVRELGRIDKISPETTFRIASLSKAFAATVAVQLEHEKKLSLSTSAISFNQDFRLKNQTQAENVTLNHVLSHRLSLPPYAYDNLLEAGVAPKKILSEMKKVDPICKVGTCYAYQNVGFNMIASAIEAKEKQPYEESVKTRLFMPLGMVGASFGKENLVSKDNWARSYKRKKGQKWKAVSVKQPYYDVPAAGGVNANIIDMSKWLAAQLGRSPQVISHNMLARLKFPQTETPREMRRMRHTPHVTAASYGLGWRIYQYAGETVINHSGSVEGYGAQIAYLPKQGVGIVLLTNSKAKEFWRILPTFLDQELGLPQNNQRF